MCEEMEQERCRWCRGTGRNSVDGLSYVCGDCRGRGTLDVCNQCYERFRADDRELFIGMCHDCATETVCRECGCNLYEEDFDSETLCDACADDLERRQ